MGPYSFTLFIGFLVVFGIYIWKKLPETKNKTYEELYREFRIENPDIAGSRLSLNRPMVSFKNFIFRLRNLSDLHLFVLVVYLWNKKYCTIAGWQRKGSQFA